MGTLSTLIEAHKFKERLKGEVDPQVCVTELLSLKNSQGKAFFAYIRIKPSQYMEYRLKLERGEMIDPNHYEILEYGWGEPSWPLQRAMQEKHGVDHEYENRIRKILERPQSQLQAAE